MVMVEQKRIDWGNFGDSHNALAGGAGRRQWDIRVMGQGGKAGRQKVAGSGQEQNSET